MTFGGQPTPWTKSQIDGLMRLYDAMGAAGGLVEYMKMTEEKNAPLPEPPK